MPSLVKRGVVEISGPSICFSHDLIHQHIYESIPLEERRRLHLDIGKFIASKVALDSSLLAKSAKTELEDLQLGKCNATFESASLSYPLVACATNQINFAGPKSVSDQHEQVRFSKWNMFAGETLSLKTLICCLHSDFYGILINLRRKKCSKPIRFSSFNILF